METHVNVVHCISTHCATLCEPGNITSGLDVAVQPWVISHELLHHDHRPCGSTHICAPPALYIMRCLIDWFGHIQHNVPLQHMHTHQGLVGRRHAARFGHGARARAHFWCRTGLRTVYPCASLTSRFNSMWF